MTPDEQEALSCKHHAFGVTVRPLRSGRWALYDQWARLITICDDLAHGVDVALATHNFDERPDWASRPPTSSRAAVALAELEALGL